MAQDKNIVKIKIHTNSSENMKSILYELLDQINNFLSDSNTELINKLSNRNSFTSNTLDEIITKMSVKLLNCNLTIYIPDLLSIQPQTNIESFKECSDILYKIINCVLFIKYVSRNYGLNCIVDTIYYPM